MPKKSFNNVSTQKPVNVTSPIRHSAPRLEGVVKNHGIKPVRKKGK